MSKDPVLDEIETDLAHVIVAWISRLEQTAGALPVEETVTDLLSAVVRSIVRSFYLPPEQRADGTIDLAVRRAKTLGAPLPEEQLPSLKVKLDADAIVDPARLQRLADVMGVDGGALIAEAIRRGVASLEAEHALNGR